MIPPRDMVTFLFRIVSVIVTMFTGCVYGTQMETARERYKMQTIETRNILKLSIYAICLNATTQNVNKEIDTAVFNVTHAFNARKRSLPKDRHCACMCVYDLQLVRLKEMKKKKSELTRTLYTISITYSDNIYIYILPII